ncbi:MAG: CrcB family protein [Paracoccus sp. (in: a-proteobacteria)]|nr:CrcB family protein [Paracoccus sp. (in: a-proteobacteria)]
MIFTLLQVALGGALGAVARFGVGLAALRWTGSAPLGTLAVNVAGCFLMGLLAAMMATRLGHLAPLLLTGLLGGFTTFSAFGLDALRLWQAGEGALAGAYVALSVVGSLGAVALGLTIGKGIWP